MEKKLFGLALIVLTGSGLISPALLRASENDLEAINHEVEGIGAYPSQWNILTLDFTLKPAEEDTLNALTIRNSGLAPYSYFEEALLYEDDGDGIFEGWKRDVEIGKGTYYDPNHIWYWKDLNVAMPKSGKRFFVAVETKNNANISVDRRTIQMGISPQYDDNNDGAFDFSKDAGIFMASKNNGPSAGILNSQSHTIYKRSVDSLPPESVVAYPTEGEEISEKSVVVKGYTRDQGGSTPAWVKINISRQGEENDVWSEVNPTDSNYADWEFDWTDIADGTYTITTRSTDWIGNSKTETGIAVIVKAAAPVPPVAEEPSEPEEKLEEKEKEVEQKFADVYDGDLIRAAGDYKVYIIKGGYKRWIQSAEIFNFYGHLSFAVVKEITRSQMESYAESWLVRAEGDTKVYEINSDGTKHWVNMAAGEFSASGRNWDMVYIVNKQEKDFYATGADVLR